MTELPNFRDMARDEFDRTPNFSVMILDRLDRIEHKMSVGFDALNADEASETAAITANTAAIESGKAALKDLASKVAALSVGEPLTPEQITSLDQSVQAGISALGASTASLNTEVKQDDPAPTPIPAEPTSDAPVADPTPVADVPADPAAPSA